MKVCKEPHLAHGLQILTAAIQMNVVYIALFFVELP